MGKLRCFDWGLMAFSVNKCLSGLYYYICRFEQNWGIQKKKKAETMETDWFLNDVSPLIQVHFSSSESYSNNALMARGSGPKVWVASRGKGKQDQSRFLLFQVCNWSFSDTSRVSFRWDTPTKVPVKTLSPYRLFRTEEATWRISETSARNPSPVP